MKFARARSVEVIFAMAAIASIGVGALSSWLFESRIERQVSEVLRNAGVEWVEIEPNGTLLELSGTAPNRTLWLLAMTSIQEIVPDRRIVDRTSFAEVDKASLPEFWLRLLGKGSDIFIFGVLPDTSSHTQVTSTIEEAFPNHALVDTSRAVNGVSAPNWQEALAFGIEAFLRVPNANVVVSDSKINVLAYVNSGIEKEILTTELASIAPTGIDVDLDIAAARPLFSPYTLQFELGDDGASLLTCHAETDSDRNRIIAAAVDAGVQSTPPCALARGAPSADWADIMASGISTLHSLGGGKLIARDSLIEMKLDDSASEDAIDRVAKDYAEAVGPNFTLKMGRLGDFSENAALIALSSSEFHATRHADGTADIAGVFPDAISREIAVAFAHSMFETTNVNDRTEVGDKNAGNLLDKILPGIEALSQLHEGNLRVAKDMLEISGTTEHDEIPAKIDELLEGRIGDADLLASVRHDASISVPPEPPSPGECAARAKGVLADGSLEFEPGSSELSARSQGSVKRLADALADCTHAGLEIAGFTDSQGREGMNLTLSAARARAVLAALLAHGILTKNFTSRGYGESQPIATNSTPEGREKNRRIEIRLPQTADAQLTN